ncbi:MAG: DUF4139 domain-containing protein [Alphaproteobacteria bacterium]
MRKLRRLTVVLMMTVSLPALAQDASLTLKRVLLSSGGIAYLEHEARVDGDARLRLDVPLDQVDDVLKSLVVFDDEGRVAGMVLPGKEPLAQAFRELPFDAAALNDPATLLASLRGAAIEVEGPTPLSGQVMSAVREAVTDPDGRLLQQRTRVTLVTADGLRQFVLEDATSVSFADETLAGQVREALAAMLAAGARDRRQVTVLSRGDGERDLRVGYVVGAPLWKAAYRLNLDAADDSDGQGLLQGWAVLENMTGRDWDDIDLSLTSGSPVTFRQALYEAYYVDRPTVPVEVFGRVLPPADTGAIAAREEERRRDSGGAMQRLGGARAAKEAVASMADRMLAAPPPAPAMAEGAIAAETEEAATQVLFRVPEPVSVKAGDSLSIPLIDREVSAAPVSLYQPATQERHPLAAVLLKNESDSALPPGVLTLYQGGRAGAAFLGDARLGPLPAGEERLLSFAVDTKTKVDREVRSTNTLLRGSIARGVLRLMRSQRQITTYTVAAPAKEPRRLIIEHRRLSGWEMTEPSGAVEKTDASYRLPLMLQAGETRKLDVTLERQIGERLRILDLNDDQIGFFAAARELTPELRQAFVRLAELKRAVDAPGDELARLEAEREAIFTDQRRIRDNLGRLQRGTDLHQRYLAKLEAQETRLEDIAEAIEAAQTRQQAARDALTAYVDGLKL